MELLDLLRQNREALVKKWHEAVLGSYPAESVKVLSRSQNRFQNPMGYNLKVGLIGLYDELLGDLNIEKIRTPLDAVIRIRSVQDFTPSEAVNCIFPLKDLIREELKKEISKNNLYDQLLDFESKIDRLALHAFDNYTACRENLFDLRIREAKSGSIKLIDRLNRRSEINSDD